MDSKPKRRPKPWKILTPEDKKGIVRTLLSAGYTREAVGKALGTTKNAIVAFQYKHLPELTDRVHGTLEIVPEEVLRQLLSSTWPVEESDKKMVKQAYEQVLSNLRAEAPQAVGAKRPKLAASEATQCNFRDSNGHPCALEWTDQITKRCDAHRKLR